MPRIHAGEPAKYKVERGDWKDGHVEEIVASASLVMSGTLPRSSPTWAVGQIIGYKGGTAILRFGVSYGALLPTRFLPGTSKKVVPGIHDNAVDLLRQRLGLHDLRAGDSGPRAGIARIDHDFRVLDERGV